MTARNGHRVGFKSSGLLALPSASPPAGTEDAGGDEGKAERLLDGWPLRLFTCEFSGQIAKIDLGERRVIGYLKLKMPATRLKEGSSIVDPQTEICTATKGMPQDIRISPDGKRFYIADMDADGLHLVDGESFKEVGFIVTGLGAHGLYPSRDGRSYTWPTAARTRSTARSAAPAAPA